jgi:hypothetical protein
MTSTASAPAYRRSRLLQFSLLTCVAGIATTLPLLIKETPYTFVLFMFVGQPLLGVAFVLFVLKVFGDLRRGSLL